MAHRRRALVQHAQQHAQQLRVLQVRRHHDARALHHLRMRTAGLIKPYHNISGLKGPVLRLSMRIQGMLGCARWRPDLNTPALVMVYA